MGLHELLRQVPRGFKQGNSIVYIETVGKGAIVEAIEEFIEEFSNRGHGFVFRVCFLYLYNF